VARWYHWTGAAYHSDYPATSDGVGRSCRHERISGQFLLNSSKLRAEINSEPSRRARPPQAARRRRRHRSSPGVVRDFDDWFNQWAEGWPTMSHHKWP
jgi:hypothetical protein